MPPKNGPQGSTGNGGGQRLESGTPNGPAGALANYTLPGVISYLTSEFTNLERFKIMTNLEKSEMKHRILQLTSEVNSLRFLNEKQALRIEQLERALARSSTTGEDQQKLNPLAGDDKTPASELDSSPLSGPENTLQKGLDSLDLTEDNDDASLIPHIDLSVLRASRQNLDRSIREIVQLLKPPAGASIPRDVSLGRGYERLLEDSERFNFEWSDSPPQPRSTSPRPGVFERYTLGSDDEFMEPKMAFDDMVDSQNPVGTGESPDMVRLQESDSETVVFDDD